MSIVQSGREHLQRVVGDPATRLQLAVALLVFALAVQRRLPDVDSPALVYYLLFILGAVLLTAVLLQGLSGREAAGRRTSRTAHAPPKWVWVAAPTSIACGVVGARLAGQDPWNAQWWWLAATCIPVLSLIAGNIHGYFFSGTVLRVSWVVLGEAGALFLVALIVRVIDITGSPPFLLGDEAQCGLFGRIFDAGKTPLLSISWFGLPMFSFAISGVGLRVFGDDLLGLRLVNAVIGTIGVVLTYYLGREWFSRRVGLLAGALMSVTFLHLELSRDGIHYIQGPTSITLTLLLCTLWMERGGIMTALVAGMSMALAVQVYWSARIVFLLVPAMLIYATLADRTLPFVRWRELVWMAVGGLAAGLPVLGLFEANPGSFNGHQGDVSVFSSAPDTKIHLISQYGHVGMPAILLQQSWKILTAFNIRGDASPIFAAWGKPILDDVSAVLLPAGLCLAILRLRRWQYASCVTWVAIVLAGGVLTTDPPLWHRLLGAAPAYALLMGLLLAAIWDAVTQHWPRFAPGVVAALAVVLAVIAISNICNAFDGYPSTLRQTSLAPTRVGEFLARAPGSSETVLLSDGTMYVNYEPIQFLAPHASGCTLMPGQPLALCPIARMSKLFVLLGGRVQDLPWLEHQRPGGKVVTIAAYNHGLDRILAYELR